MRSRRAHEARAMAAESDPVVLRARSDMELAKRKAEEIRLLYPGVCVCVLYVCDNLNPIWPDFQVGQ